MSTAGRTLAYGYDALGNLTSKTSDVAGDADAETYAYGTGPVSPTRLLSAALGGRATTFAYDADGQVVRHDGSSGDDAFIEWDGRGGLPRRITVGAAGTDAVPTARDEFRYGPAGERHHRRTTWRETADGASRTRTAEVYRAGATERVVGDAEAAHPWVEKTRVGPALAVRTSATSTPAATTKSAVIVSVERQACIVRRYAEPALRGNRRFFRQLRDLAEENASQLAVDSLVSQVRPKASEAFRERRFADAVSLYESIGDHLTVAERAKLKAARRRR